ncbi:protein of unknown function [Rhodovastum atsumiense]|nr:protein of unknown function [Rhodovastum atsumiense]
MQNKFDGAHHATDRQNSLLVKFHANMFHECILSNFQLLQW